MESASLAIATISTVDIRVIIPGIDTMRLGIVLPSSGRVAGQATGVLGKGFISARALKD
jgi:hypothetical protein